MAAGHLLDAGAEADLDALVGQHLGDVVVGLVRERLEQRVAVVDQVDVRGGGVDGAVLGGTVTASMSAIAPATSTPVGPPPTITKFSAPRSTSDGSRSTCSKSPRMRERRRVASSSE